MVAAGLVAGCSDDDGDADEPDDRPDPAGAELVVGYVGQESGGASPSGAPAAEGRLALATWVRWTNDHGGVGGHRVRLVTRDGGGDPDRTVEAARELVEEEGVVAVLGQQDTCCFEAWAAAVTDLGVPVIGGQAQTSVPRTNPLVFSQSTSVVSQLYGQVAKVGAVGATRFGHLHCTERPACGAGNDLLRAAAARAGVAYVFEQAVGADDDYSAACAAAAAAGVEVLQLNGVSVDRVTADCEARGFRPVYGIVGDAPSLLDVPGLDGAVGVLPAFPVFHDGPETAELRRAMARHARDLDPTVVTSQAWLSGLAFALAVERSGADEPTAADVVRGLLTFRDETFGGLTPPITYGPEGQPNPPLRCWYLFGIRDGAYTTLQGLEPDCEPVA